MPIEGTKEFSAASTALEKLADGVKSHAAEEKFPPSLVEDDIRGLRTRLEQSREEYEKQQKAADKLYKAYSEVLGEAATTVADAQRLLQGFHGFRSDDLKDYGFVPPKKSGRKGSKE